MRWHQVSWETIFVLQQSPWETIIRGSLVYLSLFVLLRFGLRRETGNVGMADLLVVVLIAEAATEAIGTNIRSIPDCILLASVIIFWAYVLDWLGYRSKTVGRFLHPHPLLLVRDGRMLRHNMRRELITEDELMSQLREHGVENLAQVRKAFIEGDGQISVVTDQEQPAAKEQRNVL